jgi:hypothetical protein
MEPTRLLGEIFSWVCLGHEAPEAGKSNLQEYKKSKIFSFTLLSHCAKTLATAAWLFAEKTLIVASWRAAWFPTEQSFTSVSNSSEWLLAKLQYCALWALYRFSFGLSGFPSAL